MNWNQRTFSVFAVFAVFVVLVYFVLAGALVYVAYCISPPTTTDQYKEFVLRAGIALSAAGAIVGIIVSFFTLAAQIRAARDLEAKKGEILLNVEARKKDILVELENLKGTIVRENELLKRALDAKSIAYDKLFVASNNCYRELQNLGKGLYDATKVEECERSLREAEGLAANLDAEDREIVMRIMQSVFNIVDEAGQLRLRGDAFKKGYEEIWNKNSRPFGQAIEDLRNRSLFHSKSIKAGWV